MRTGRRGAGESECGNGRSAAQADEIILEVEPASLPGAQAGPDRVVGHRQQPRPDAEPAAEILDDGRQATAGIKAAGGRDMRREIAVAEPEPGLAAKRFERLHKGPGLAGAPPA